MAGFNFKVVPPPLRASKYEGIMLRTKGKTQARAITIPAALAVQAPFAGAEYVTVAVDERAQAIQITAASEHDLSARRLTRAGSSARSSPKTRVIALPAMSLPDGLYLPIGVGIFQHESAHTK